MLRRLGVIPTCERSPQLREGRRREAPERREPTLRTDFVGFMAGRPKPPPGPGQPGPSHGGSE